MVVVLPVMEVVVLLEVAVDATQLEFVVRLDVVLLLAWRYKSWCCR